MSLTRRIIVELTNIEQDPIPNFILRKDTKNIRYFFLEMEGPIDSPYHGYKFDLELFLPIEYPMKPPKIRFLTKIYHPNIDRIGRICLDILKDRWTPIVQIRTLCISISMLLQKPNVDDPLVAEIAEAWKATPQLAWNTAVQWCKMHARAI